MKTLDGKMPWRLLAPFIGALEAVINVLEYGNTKYQENDWQEIENKKQVYSEALMRHMTAYWRGERDDPESGLSHVAHAACCILILIWSEMNER